MRGEYRFLRHRGGIASVARVTVELHPDSAWSVSWEKLVSDSPSYPPRVFYRSAAEEGVMLAAREHERRGGEPYQVHIVQVVEWPADTRADAVRCAAALATWGALGHAEAEATIVFLGEEWQVTFDGGMS